VGFVSFLVFFLCPTLSFASIRCSNSGSDYSFFIVRNGSQYTISGTHRDGRYTGHCDAVAHNSDGRVLLTGTDKDEFLRRQCFAEIVLDVNIGSKVSVPDNKTYGDLSNNDLTCSGTLD